MELVTGLLELTILDSIPQVLTRPITVLRRLRQENHNFKACKSYTVSSKPDGSLRKSLSQDLKRMLGAGQ